MTKPLAMRVADLAQNRPTAFDLEPTADEMRALADELGLSALRKLRFSGQLTPHGTRDWRLTARLGATVVQPCVVTLDPVTTRIDTDVQRTYLADWVEPEGEEVEISEDDSIEPLGEVIDPTAVMAESLALALPLYPRAPGAELGEAVFTEPGQAAMRDEDARPFATLAALRDKLSGDD